MKILRNAQGIAIVYVTLFLLVLGILFFALGIDIGWMAYVKTQGQAATDASALAGAAAVPHYAANAGSMTKVNELAGVFDSNNTVMNTNSSSLSIVPTGKNVVEVCGGSASSPVCPPLLPIQAAGVRVTRTFTTPLFFTRLLNGSGSTNISVTSTAWLGAPGGLKPELPVALCLSDIYVNPNADPRVCVSPYFTEFSPNNDDNAGWWNKVGVGVPSDKECRDYVNDPTTIPYLGLSDPIDLNNGQLNDCHKTIEKKFESCSALSCSGAEGAAKKELCTVILPVVNCQNAINNNEPVQEFAAICITKVVSTPVKDAVIEGILQCNVPVPGTIGGGDSNGGVYATRPVLTGK